MPSRLVMNVQGIPYANHPDSFWAITIFCVLLGAVIFAYFYWRHWLKR